jgi:hypothetical protein
MGLVASAASRVTNVMMLAAARVLGASSRALQDSYASHSVLRRMLSESLDIDGNGATKAPAHGAGALLQEARLFVERLSGDFVLTNRGGFQTAASE